MRAGIELVSVYMYKVSHGLLGSHNTQDESASECGDGQFEESRYFSCEFGHGYFCLLEEVQPDQRFVVVEDPPKKAKTKKDTPRTNRESLRHVHFQSF